MRLKLEPADIERLLASPDYRAFIAVALEVHARGASGMSYAKLARLIGVKARSYPRDIVTGAKRMRPTLLPKFTKALGLTADWAAYFTDLVEEAEESCRSSGRSPEQIALSRARIRSRLRQQAGAALRLEPAFAIADLPIVYAALGTAQTGATLTEIERRTGLGDERLLPVLEKMLELGIAARAGRRYLPKKMHFSTTDLKGSDVFKSYFLKKTEEVLFEARRRMNSDEKLFFSSAFSVTVSQLPELKAELRDLLLRYVDAAEKPTGDRVVSLVCALH